MSHNIFSILRKKDRSSKVNFLEDAFSRYNRTEFLQSDPVLFIHRYSEPKDQELVGFLAALFAYGKVVLVQRSLEKILLPMGPSPYLFLKSWNGKSCWSGFAHRFHKEDHLICLMYALQNAIKEFGSIECFFRAGLDLKLNKSFEAGRTSLENVLHFTSCWLEKHALEYANQNKKSDPRRAVRFLFTSPLEKSACKRVLLFLRWMVRKDEIDLGLWNWISPAELIIPVDTHISRISFLMGLRKGPAHRSPDWKMAIEITNNLKKFHEQDPVRYDFALTRLGMEGASKSKVKSIVNP